MLPVNGNEGARDVTLQEAREMDLEKIEEERGARDHAVGPNIQTLPNLEPKSW